MTTAPDTLTRPHEWTLAAACRHPDVDPNWWDARGDSSTAAKARHICHTICPVRQQCLADAQRIEGISEPRYRQGTRGGLTPTARYELARRTRETGPEDTEPAT